LPAVRRARAAVNFTTHFDGGVRHVGAAADIASMDIGRKIQLRQPESPSQEEQEPTMARKPTTRTEFVLFDVFYEDGTQRSNRRVPGEILGGLDGDEPARAAIEEQDRIIAEKSGTPVAPIKSIRRSGAKPPREAGKAAR
jgi:hypothetical protein